VRATSARDYNGESFSLRDRPVRHRRLNCDPIVFISGPDGKNWETVMKALQARTENIKSMTVYYGEHPSNERRDSRESFLVGPAERIVVESVHRNKVIYKCNAW